MDIQVSETGNYILLRIEGKLDSTTSMEFGTIAESKAKEKPTNMIIDLSELSYISSSGLRIFLQLAKIVKQNGTKLFLAAMQGQVKEIFDLAGFTPYFSIVNSVDEASSRMGNESR
ncbi:MAG: STAS domain-containing protein [Acidobacteria bacterium]|nr:STAS domain-containing protein [Acidobacteriota bacterium]